MRHFSVCFALTIFAVEAWGQSARPKQISAAEAQQLEETLKSTPNDKSARGSLLDYYFNATARVAPAPVIEARRRHILWFIENAPDDDQAGSPAATIDAAGHRLADAEGFKLASAAWRARAARKDVKAIELENAAFFFKLSNNAYTIDLLEQALIIEPGSERAAGFLGVSYAMAILGVTMVNRSGFPLAVDARLLDAPLANKARLALDSTKNVITLARAGYTLSFQGSILRSSGKISFDTGTLAEKVLQRALSLDPRNSGIRELLAQHRELYNMARAK